MTGFANLILCDQPAVFASANTMLVESSPGVPEIGNYAGVGPVLTAAAGFPLNQYRHRWGQVVTIDAFATEIQIPLIDTSYGLLINSGYAGVSNTNEALRVKATLITGSLDSGTTGAWQWPRSGGSAFYVTGPGGYAEIYLEFALVDALADVIATKYVTLSAP